MDPIDDDNLTSKFCANYGEVVEVTFALNNDVNDGSDGTTTTVVGLYDITEGSV